jgi:putative transposase
MLNSPAMEKHSKHRLPHPYYVGPRNYFLTICAGQRRRLFTDAPLVKRLTSELTWQFRSHGFTIFAYCFMPDHCHVLAAALTETSDLAKAVRAFKGVSATMLALWGCAISGRDYYDHILRSSESFHSVAAYIF